MQRRRHDMSKYSTDIARCNNMIEMHRMNIEEIEAEIDDISASDAPMLEKIEFLIKSELRAEFHRKNVEKWTMYREEWESLDETIIEFIEQA
jgi:hypothetical protein